MMNTPPEPLAKLSPDDAVIGSSTLYTCFALFIATAAIFSRASVHGFVNYDDAKYVYANPFLVHTPFVAQLKWAFTTIYFSNYHPILLLAEVLIARTFGTTAPGFHICSILLHACNVALLFLLLQQTTHKKYLAVAVAVLWGWHPLRVESVAWVSELKDTLSTFFWLLSLLAFVRFTQTRRALDYTSMILAAIVACGSKPMAVTLPVTVLLLNVWPLRRLSLGLIRLVAETIPLFVLVAVFSVSTWLAQRSVAQHLDVITWPARLQNALLSTGVYIKSTLIPTHLAVFYPHLGFLHRPISRWWIVSGVLTVVLSILAVGLRRRWPVLFFGWFWYLITLLPVIGIIQVGEQAHADRYSYVPSIGLTIIIVWSIDRLLTFVSPRQRTVIGGGAMIVIVGVLIYLTQLQINTWENTQTLFEHALEVTDDNHLAMDMVAVECLHSGDNVRALALARRAYHLRPRSSSTSDTLGDVYDHLNLYDKAAAAFARAVALTPGDATLHENYGAMQAKLGNRAAAEKGYREAIRLQPTLAGAHANLGLLLASENDMAGAVSEWRTATHLDASLYDTYANLARAEELAGENDIALADYRAAIDGAPNPASGWLLSAAWLAATSPTATAAQIDTANADARRALEAIGNKATTDPIAYDTLAAALARQGRFDEAVSAVRIALAAHPPAGLDKMIRQRLDGYLAGRPFIRPSASSHD